MRSALRAVTAGTVTVGLVASTVALAVPTVATASPAAPAAVKATTARISVTNTPYVGGLCKVGVRLTTSSGQVSGAKVVVQARPKGTKAWSTVKTVTTKKSSSVTVSRTSSRAVQFRAVYAGSTALGADNSSTVTCKPIALRLGVQSAGVKKLAKKLKALRIRPASTSSYFGANTQQAVFAYQKSRILKRTGVVDGKLYAKIMATKKMTPSGWCKKTDTICIDISKQAAYLKVKGKTYTIPVSSGGNYYYYDPESKTRDFAKTPTGTFKVYYKKPGTSKGPLGTYYWMSFFSGGYGVHGSASVPTYPASHGCVRVPRSIEQWVFKNLPTGSVVHLHK